MANGSANPLRTFNVVSNVKLTTRVHPAVALTIFDAYVRRPENATRVIGTLLGYIGEGNVLEVSDCFTVKHQDTDAGVLMDQEYHRQMVKLRQRVSSKEQVIGWFCTGKEILETSVVIHNFYLGKDSGFSPSQLLPVPIHMTVNTDLTSADALEEKALSIKAYIMKETPVADNLVQFHEIPLSMDGIASDRTGVNMLLQAREEKKNGGEEAKEATLSGMDGFQTALQQLVDLLSKVKQYTADVNSGKIKGDPAIGRELTRVMCAEPFFNVEAFENLCAGSLQDTLMVVYLSNLTRTQITLAEKINAAYTTDR